jgi:hypothetical protein
MNKLNSWERLENNIGKGVKIIKFREKTPFEKIMDMGKEIKTREYLESKKVGIPKYTRSQKKKIRRDMENYFNSVNRRHEAI